MNDFGLDVIQESDERIWSWDNQLNDYNNIWYFYRVGLTKDNQNV